MLSLLVNGAVSLGYMLPANYVQSAIQGSQVNICGCPRFVAIAKAKAKAKPKVCPMSTIIGKVQFVRK